MRTLLPVVALLLVGAPVLAGSWPQLRPAVRWLESERLRGTLFHDPMYQPMPQRHLEPSSDTPLSPARPITVIGEAYFLLLPDEGRDVAADVTAVTGHHACPDTVYALFDPNGREVAFGRVAPGKTARVASAGREGVHTLLINSGPGSRNTARVRPRTRTWCLDAGSHRYYDQTPLKLHFLRDLRDGGFNLAMVDFERLDDDFLTDMGMLSWTRQVRNWTDYARRVGLRVMPAVNLGGSPAEVQAWEGCRPGLYTEPDETLPTAPCPLDREYWERLYLVRGRAVARMSLTNPCIVGYGLDPEMYQAWKYGHYMMTGTCFCDYCVGGFLRSKSLDEAVLGGLATGQSRYDWLREQGLYDGYDKYLEDEMAAIAAWCRDELHAINPDFLTDMFVTEIGNWFCRGIARGFGEPGCPTVNFAEHTYYGVGYDPDWLTRIIRSFRSWGAEVVQGSALWDLYFPATEPRYFAAHTYNLLTKAQGWWYWPGDNLYRDWGANWDFGGRVAYAEDFWPAAAWAHREADRWLANRAYRSALDNWAPVPWRGMLSSEERLAELDPAVAQRVSIPAYAVHVPALTTLYFRVPERRPDIDIRARVRSVGGVATLAVHGPDGRQVAHATATDEAETSLTAPDPEPGVWRLVIGGADTQPGTEVMLNWRGSSPVVASAPTVLPGVATKPPGLIGWWRLDEACGQVVTDSSPPPAINGTVRGATWSEGVQGAALTFTGGSADVFIPAGDPYHGLRRFSLAAWVRLDALPESGDGRTIINKGPEAPVQHFWWWIGYPPDYTLSLELGNENHQWGLPFSSEPLAWETGRWYHVAVTMESAGGMCTVSHYRDGQRVGQAQRPEELHSGDHDLRLGNYGGLHGMRGALDEVRFYDTVLSPAAVAALAQR